ncbi:hypothetical protein H2200_006973 [Cladophialophora chaetospira]|uniref:F-box domain-containing protein n=1 Tax=Cladophialophora chaetospira TaxID=386627 RepID=A0AA38X977_9EURO|nr:hypothetical protein H2200_006973 [Cladophialophora chaetospira]
MPRRSVSSRISAKRISQAAVAGIIITAEKLILEAEYETAHKLLNNINPRDHDPEEHQFVTLLELRVAAHIGLHDLDSALKNAKAMLELEPNDSRGYLQCARVELARDNPYTAVAYLEDGLELVRASDPLHDQLSEQLRRTQAHIETHVALSNPRDPITELPFEVVGLILSYLEYRQLVQLLRLSKAWKQALVSLPPLTDTLAFPETVSNITPKMLSAALKRWKLPKFLNLAKLTVPSTNAILQELQRWQKFPCLESIEVQGSLFMSWTLPLAKYKLKTISLDRETAVPMDWVCEILLPQCPILENALFDHVSGNAPTSMLRSDSLLELKLWLREVNRSYSDLAVVDKDVFSGLPRLERLKCAYFNIRERTPLDLRCLKNLQLLSFAECEIPNIYLPPSLKGLGLQDCWFRDEGDPELTERVFPALENLTTLNMILDTYPQFLIQAARKTQPGNLVCCDVKEWPYMFGDRLLQLLEHEWFRGLQTLIYDGSALRDTHAGTIARNCPDLRNLHVEDSLSITDVFVSELIKAPGAKIERILIQGCPEVPPDIVQWAEERGVVVEIVP